MYFDKAKALLDAEYFAYYSGATEHAQKVMDEKKCHSYQVLGVGNYLLKHEQVFASCSLEDIQRLKATLLLHDIGRFYEVFLHEDGGRVDHGVYGAQLLAKIPEFADINIVLPVRHHGHLIERLYEDEDYQKLSEKAQKEIKKITYLVRDADKIANFYLLSRHFGHIENLFFVKSLLDSHTKVPSPLVWEAFMAHTSVDVRHVVSFADQAMMYMACIYDLAYHSSFVLMKDLNVVLKLLHYFGKFWNEEYAELCQREILSYCDDRLNRRKFLLES